MSLTKLIRFSWREIFNHPRFSLFFIFNLVFGLYGLVSVDALKVSIQKSLSEQSRMILTADLSVASRRPITEEENKVIGGTLGPRVQETRVWTLYSMVSSAHGTRLCELTAIEAGYPFYGHITLESAGNAGGPSMKRLFEEPSAWVYKELASSLHLKAGDTVTIGDSSFRVADIVTEDSAHGFRAFDLAPRIYIGLSQLPKTHLLRPGSTVWYTRLFKLPSDLNADVMARRLDRRLTDSGIEVQSARQSSESLARLQGFLDDYLSLVALVALFLAVLGAAYLFRSFLAARLRDIAIYQTLGLSLKRTRWMYIFQLAILGSAAAAVAVIAAGVTLPLTIRVLASFVSYPVRAIRRWQEMAAAFGIGAVGSIVVCLPFLNQLKTLRIGMLFQENASEFLEESRAWGSAIPALLFYGGLSVWQSHSWKVGGLFTGLFLVSAFLLAGAAWVFARLLRLFPQGAFPQRLAWRYISRARWSSLSIFIAIGLGTLLIDVIPQIEKSLETEMTRPNVSQVAGLFLFDIQPDELSPLQAWVGQQGIALNAITPLIRGRLISINGVAYEKDPAEGQWRTREEERSARARNRGFNLTFRAHLNDSEKIIAGHDFTGTYQAGPSSPPAELSVEKAFADRLKLKLNDQLVFDIQGITVPGVIVNFRRVNWASFQPNFFIQFQPGVLEGAPMTYLASISGLDVAARAHFQEGVARRFPNISLIDVSALVRQLLQIFTQMGWALRVMAALSLLAGLLVVFSIAHHQARLRQQECNLMKVLGAPFDLIRRIFDWEFGGLTLAASFCGTVLSFLLSYVLSLLLFNHVWVFAGRIPLALFFVTPLLSLATARLATRRILRQRPLTLLQAETT